MTRCSRASTPPGSVPASTIRSRSISPPRFAGLGHSRGDFPVAERLAGRILSLPIFPGITAAQQERVVETLAAAVARMTGDEVFVHPLGVCETDTVGAGTRIWAFAHVLAGAAIGADCNICDHAFIEGGAVVGDRVTVKNGVTIWDGVTIEDDAFIGPNVVFTNDFVPRAHIRRSPDELERTLVRSGASIGANATVVCGVTIGANALVGAGTVVIRDVPAHARGGRQPGPSDRLGVPMW